MPPTPQPVEAEEDGEGGVITVEPFDGEQERPELGSVHPVAAVGMDLGAADVLGRVGRYAAVDVGEPVEATDGAEPAVDRRRCQPALFHRRAVQLDVRPGRPEHVETVLARPFEEHVQVVPVGVERATVVTSQERHRGELCLTTWTPSSSVRMLVEVASSVVMGVLPLLDGRTSEHEVRTRR